MKLNTLGRIYDFFYREGQEVFIYNCLIYYFFF